MPTFTAPAIATTELRTLGRDADESRPLRILHLSDLHERAPFEGMTEARAALLLTDAEKRGYVFSAPFDEALRSIGQNGVDLVCFTGDLADWGKPEEYIAATARIDTILRAVNVPRSRFFAVPGNHDIERSIGEDALNGVRLWLNDSGDVQRLGMWMREAAKAPVGIDPEWRAQILRRQASFWDWFGRFRGAELGPRSPKLLGYRHTFPKGSFPALDMPLHIVGLDSAWLCGGSDDQGKICVTVEQVLGHIRNGEQPLQGLRIGLVHHPLDHLADHHDVRRLLADNGVDMLLHGHQHSPLAVVTDEPGARLRVLAAGCLMEGELAERWPNGFQLLELCPRTLSYSVQFRKWSARSRGWVLGSDIYREAPAGVLHVAGGEVQPRPTQVAQAASPKFLSARLTEMTSPCPPIGSNEGLGPASPKFLAARLTVIATTGKSEEDPGHV